MKPYYADDTIRLFHGNALDVLASLPDGSVDCCVTSPPYFGLRDYGVEGQHGAESSPAEYVKTMRATFSQVRRVLADDGTLWLNLGDSYGRGSRPMEQPPQTVESGGRYERSKVPRPQSKESLNLPPKNMLGVPWRVAFALQDDGWILRNDIIWAKPNAMPESVTDRLSNRHEHLFMFSKSRRYWFDLDAIREPHAEKSVYQQEVARRRPHAAGKAGTAVVPGQGAQTGMAAGGRELNERGANPGDVWTIATAPFPGAHFATFPIELPRRAIAAGCKPAGTVLDPYSGSGTTGLAAGQLGRKYVGIDLNTEYLDLSLKTRLAQGTLMDTEAGF